MHWIVDFAYLLAALVYLPKLLYEMIALNKNRRGWRERFGSLKLRPTGQGRVWVHAVSLGEVNAARRVVEALGERFPEREIVISTTTDTGYARACTLFGQERVFRFPLDFSFVVRRAFRLVDPAMIVLVEQEVWFNLVRLAAARAIPVVVVNGRLTERSAGRLAKVSAFSRRMFANLAWVGAQDEAIAARFRALGVPAARLTVTGSLKWDTAEVTDSVPGASDLAAAMGLPGDRPLWVCGSTGPGEEEIVLSAYQRLLDDGRRVALVIVPRKPERFDEVATLIERRGFACVRRSRTATSAGGGPHSGKRNEKVVFLGDTTGELRKFYSLAELVFVGRSLVPMGGSDPMEVAALGKAMICGVHMENFEAPTRALREAGALSVIAPPDRDRARTVRSTRALKCHAELARALADRVTALVADSAERQRTGAAGRGIVLHQQGATDVTTTALAHLLESRPAERIGR